jgi:hypothetical protein
LPGKSKFIFKELLISSYESNNYTKLIKRKNAEGAISLYLQDPENSFLILSGYGWRFLDINSIASKYSIPYEKILMKKSLKGSLKKWKLKKLM